MTETLGLPLIVLLPFAGALLPGLVARYGPNTSAWATAAVTAAAIALLALLAPPVFHGHIAVVSWPWIEAIGLNLSFRLDGLGLVFSTLVLGIGLLVIVYSRYYLPASDSLGRFYTYMLLFMGAMLGIVLADNLLLLLFFWELTSISSFLLIGYWGDRDEARRGARLALALTGLGGLALLGGVLLIGQSAGSYDLSIVLETGATVRSDPLYPLILALVMLAAFTKSAQFPFHFWLPHAMEAPTPVSAYLHSATMVNAGVFLLARLFPVLSGSEMWFSLVASVGLFTLLFGAYTALFKHDLKGLLAYSTISHLGLITMLLGLGTPLGAVAAIFHVINHAIFKASLFMAAGIIDHETGSRDMRKLNGLWRFMPYTATLAIIAASAMAGVPLLNGFLSKEMFFAETVHHEWLTPLDWLLPATAVLAGIFSVAYSVRFIHDVFFNGLPLGLPRRPKEPRRYMRVPVEILVLLCLLVGIFPQDTVKPFLNVSAAELLNTSVPPYHLQIWQGITVPFVMSMMALSGGVAVYALRERVFRLHDRFLFRIDARMIFDRLMFETRVGCRRVTDYIENGSLQRYLTVLLVSAITLGVLPVFSTAPILTVDLDADAISLMGFLILSAAAIATVLNHRRRRIALVTLSVCGLVVSLLFVQFSAPDLALTQLSVEVVSTILLLLALYFLPQRTPIESSSGRRLRDGLLAAAAGGGAAWLSLAALNQHTQSISDFYVATSKSEAGGSNVVNVILVDFRAFDTLGEISVLAISAVIIYALLDGLQLQVPQRDFWGRPWSEMRHSLILSVVSGMLLPLALVFSIYLFFRGHNAPGGGFIAGLVTGAALILQYMARGIEWTRSRISLNYFYVTGSGILVAGLIGLAPLLFGAPFLSSTIFHWHLPRLGDLEWSSATLLDLGVYLVVVGAVTLILANLGHVSHVDRPRGTHWARGGDR